MVFQFVNMATAPSVTSGKSELNFTVPIEQQGQQLHTWLDRNLVRVDYHDDYFQRENNENNNIHPLAPNPESSSSFEYISEEMRDFRAYVENILPHSDLKFSKDAVRTLYLACQNLGQELMSGAVKVALSKRRLTVLPKDFQDTLIILRDARIEENSTNMQKVKRVKVTHEALEDITDLPDALMEYLINPYIDTKIDDKVAEKESCFDPSNYYLKDLTERSVFRNYHTEDWFCRDGFQHTTSDSDNEYNKGTISIDNSDVYDSSKRDDLSDCQDVSKCLSQE